MTATDEELKKRVGEADVAVTLILIHGDTFWRLADCKYGGIHPIDAIYEINNLMPLFEDLDGMPGFRDPIYFAGASYVLPSIKDVPQLRKQFWQKFDGRTVGERVGSPTERTAVCIRWDETFWDLSAIKYGGQRPVQAIFQLNKMQPVVNMIDGEKQVLDPLYHPGRSYLFPSEDEIAELTAGYESQINSLIS